MLGNQNNNDNSKLFILKIKTTDAEKHKIDPIFQVSEKNSETNKWGVTNSVSTISGDLKKIDIREQEYLGEKYNTVSYYFKDNDTNETYLLDTRLNLLTRNLANSILSLEDFTDIKLSLYTNKKNGYAAISVRSHGELTNWKFDNRTDVPAIDEIKDKKGNIVKRDFSDVDNFYIEKLRELAAKLTQHTVESVVKSSPVKKSGPVANTKKKVAPQTELDEVSSGPNQDDDLF